jgi:hypothetical protein
MAFKSYIKIFALFILCNILDFKIDYIRKNLSSHINLLSI